MPAGEEHQQERIVPVDLADEMKRSYIDYAMSVIIARALPDVRDGLKPVHRRILFAMDESNMTFDRPYVKSARPVSDVMGKYHPHGDVPIYDAMVRLAQDFNCRYPMVDGHGNFGSVDGDPPAHMRYTEARLAKIAQEMLRDIDKETVDFAPNYDGKEQEPLVLPAHLPYLLINGASGIAVGMATNIPPHNLGEVLQGAMALLDDPEITIAQLMEHIPGPDFPTAGQIMGREGISSAYHTGRGSVTMRARSRIERLQNGRTRIIVDQLPYQVNKARLIERIALLVRDKKIDGITDLNDESDRDGMRIVIDLRRDTNPTVLLNQLYAHTSLQMNFGVIMLALDDGVPKVMTLKEVLAFYLAHQRAVLLRRLNFELTKALDRAHILEGLRIAVANIDAVIRIIRTAADDDVAKNDLMLTFSLSERQATAVLDMRLRRLTSLELEKLEEEYRQVMDEVLRLRTILADETLQVALVRTDLERLQREYSDPRRSEIVADAGELEVEDLIAEEEMVVTLTHQGYIKRLPATTYRTQRRGGRGVAGMGTKEEDFVESLFVTSTHHDLLFFTDKGKVYTCKVYNLPEAGRQAKGTNLVNLLQISGAEKVSTVIAVKEGEYTGELFFCTRRGVVKKGTLDQFSNVRVTGMIAMKLAEEDELVGVLQTKSGDDIFIATRQGKVIRFNEHGVRVMGRNTAGVRGISLAANDEVIALDVVSQESELLVVTENGYGKRTRLDEYRGQSRGGKGILLTRVSARSGAIAGIRLVRPGDEVMVITAQGIIIRTPVDDINRFSRVTQGVNIMDLKEGDRVVALAKVVPQRTEDEQLTFLER
ncbi:MAG: DNA gyrase subunit A [Symbiobacteriaceae bacterium]|nr:DNA gyrase subunit A [Symbiobacteriaceae bacterium]